jgi:hypothetical protein
MKFTRVAIILGLIISFCGIAGAVALHDQATQHQAAHSAPAAQPTTAPSEAQLEQYSQDAQDAQSAQNDQLQQDLQANSVSQYYYYCWDTGDPSPHHLGYPVSGDHYCTDGELHNAGIAGY